MIYSNNDKSVKCFHHNDADGLCSASVVLQKYKNATPISMDFTTTIDLSSINKNDKIYIVDYSIAPADMEKLLKITDDVTWIDHHESTIDKYKDFKHDIKGLRYIGESGCMLTYCYFNKMDEGKVDFDLSMIADVPRYIDLINDWDIWRFRFGDITRYFQIGFNMNFKDFSDKNAWDSINDNVDKYISEGEIASRFINDWSSKYCNKFGFEVEFEGYHCFAMNLGLSNSTYFDSIKKDSKYDILIPFTFNGKNWTLSFYSEEGIDVSKIAMKYGGGGHTNAAGCIINTETITKLFFKK